MAKKSKRLNIQWTETAEKQFFNILDYWNERNRSTAFANKLADLVWNKTKFIAENPLASKPTKFPNTRIAALGHFSIVYKLTEDKIWVLAFWDNRQDPKKLYQYLISQIE
ncbi:MAG TPA: type II toxin-antitoxin system RelE/ParE family toxin [Anditalea sp.]|nr:type II toxin-antitoxin system RelE/ParE family toxin [Anditalea sp.]